MSAWSLSVLETVASTAGFFSRGLTRSQTCWLDQNLGERARTHRIGVERPGLSTRMKTFGHNQLVGHLGQSGNVGAPDFTSIQPSSGLLNRLDERPDVSAIEHVDVSNEREREQDILHSERCHLTIGRPLES